MAKWHYIANAFFELYKIMVNKVTFAGFRADDRPCFVLSWQSVSRCALEVCELWFLESRFNPVLQNFNPNPLRIREQHETGNPTPVGLHINLSHANNGQWLFSANTKSKSIRRSCWRKQESGSKKSKILSMHTSAVHLHLLISFHMTYLLPSSGVGH